MAEAARDAIIEEMKHIYLKAHTERHDRDHSPIALESIELAAQRALAAHREKGK